MSPIYSFRFDIILGRSTHDVLLLFAATATIASESLATSLEEEIAANLVPDELFIVVREPAFAATLRMFEEDSLNKATFSRLRDRATITLVGYDRRGSESSRHHIGGPQRTRKIVFADFRRLAITNIFIARHGFVESTSTYHFENPSGRHTERFIRLSNILVRGAEIAFIGFCTLPLMPDLVSIAYLDTPSLYAIVAAINEQLSSFPDTGTPILADNFSSYGGLPEYRFDRQTDALVLISASSSGSLASRLIKDYGFDPRRVVHVLFLGTDGSGTQRVCDLRWDPKVNSGGIKSMPLVEQPTSCRMCATGSIAIKLQGDQFDIAGPQPSSLLIKKADAPASLADLMARAAGEKIFTVGLGRAAGKQPRLFNVTEKALLDSKGFSDRLEYVLRRSVPASLSHVVPIDDNSNDLAERVASFARHDDSPVSIVAAKRVSDIARNTVSAVCIVAGVIESGRSLLDVSRDLRSIVPSAPLLYIVGVSKSTGEDRRESLGRTIVQTDLPLMHQLIEVERIILPASTENNAWTAELTLLQDPEVATRIPDALKSYIGARIARLRKLSEPLMNDLFLANGAMQQLSLQPGFVFWNRETSTVTHSQADVFFTISSVLQQLRANSERAEKASAIKSNWFQQTILAPGNFGRFNDDIIQACLLRAAYPFELNYSNSRHDSRELGRLIRRIIEASKTARGGAAAEFLLAIATDRLRLCLPDQEDVVSVEAKASPMVGLLLEICRARSLAK
jgi:hypothetical protein